MPNIYYCSKCNVTRYPKEILWNDAYATCPVCGTDLDIWNGQNDFEVIKSPKHYTQGKIECKDYIRDKNFNFNLGNVVKYVTRAGLKDPATRVQDLKKARQYLEFEIEYLESEDTHK